MRQSPRCLWELYALTRTVLFLVAAGSALGADDPSAAHEQPLEKVTLQLKWRHAFQFAGFYAAIEQGYYRAAGLEVNLVEAAVAGAAKISPVEAVLSGRAEYGVGTSNLLLERGAGKPVVALAAIYQHSPQVLLALRRSGVTYLQDLHDKPIMIEAQTAELLAYLKDEGLDPAKLQLVTHVYDVGKLLSGEVGAIAAYSTDEPYVLQQAGVDYVMFTPRTGGIDFYGDILFTTEAEIAAHPERVKAFREASLRGWDYAMAHPDEIIDLILKKYSRRRTREHLRFEAEETALNMHPGLIEAGHMNPGRWRHMADTYAQLGMLPADFSLEGFLYQPHAGPDLKPVYWTLGALAALTFATLGWALPLRRLNHRLREADAAKGRYMAFLTHEIRTPLSGMTGTVQLLKSAELSPELQEQVQLLDHGTKNLLQLVNNVLDCCQLKAGKLTIELQPVEIGLFTRKLTGLYRPLAEAKGLRFQHRIEPGVPPVIMTDGLRLQQILGNLLANAIKFTATGAVELTIAAAPTARGARLLFHVHDTGPGIAADQLATLFQPYQQAGQSIARQFGGSGLGLCISREMARLLHGDITVHSLPGVGSTFTVEIEAPPMPGV